LDAFVDLLAGRTALEETLSSFIVGTIKAGQQDFEIGVASNIDAEHLAGDPAIEAFDHAIGLGRIRPGRAMADLDFRAGPFKIIGGEAGAAIRQHTGDAEGEDLSGGLEEGNRIGGVLGVVDVEVDKSRAATDCDIEEALSDLAVRGTQLGQMFNVDVDKAEITILEAPRSLAGLHRRLGWSSIEAFGLQDTVNAIAVEMWQKVPE